MLHLMQYIFFKMHNFYLERAPKASKHMCPPKAFKKKFNLYSIHWCARKMKPRHRKCCWLVDSVQEYVTFSPLCSFSSSMRRDRVWMGSFRRQEPIMSSRYSNMPSSCSVWPLGFIMAICSTSPYIRSIIAQKQRHGCITETIQVKVQTKQQHL